MRRALTLLAAALLLAVPAPAAAVPTGELVVIAKLRWRHQHKPGTFTFSQNLLQHKRRVGTSRVRCERRSRRFSECRGAYRLADGTIKVEELIRHGTRNPTLEIVKGTGSFRGAAGTMHVDNLNRHTSRNTFHFRAQP